MAKRLRRALTALAIASTIAIPLAASGASASRPQLAVAPRSTLGVTLPAGYTLLAALTHGVSGYASPHGKKVASVPATWHDERLIMPVLQVKDGYYHVRLPGRPNGSTTWVKQSAVLMGATPYEIVIDLATTHLKLIFKGKVIMNAPVGVGTKADPTPTGNFFVAFFAAPPKPNPGYGPFIMVTSAHSNSITDWADSGDAMVAIHGPLGETAVIGTHGARVSHGCIRVPVKYQVKLRVVPVGTPISIID